MTMLSRKWYCKEEELRYCLLDNLVSTKCWRKCLSKCTVKEKNTRYYLPNTFVPIKCSRAKEKL
jgi:hypothetical protein